MKTFIKILLCFQINLYMLCLDVSMDTLYRTQSRFIIKTDNSLNFFGFVFDTAAFSLRLSAAPRNGKR